MIRCTNCGHALGREFLIVNSGAGRITAVPSDAAASADPVSVPRAAVCPGCGRIVRYARRPRAVRAATVTVPEENAGKIPETCRNPIDSERTA